MIGNDPAAAMGHSRNAGERSCPRSRQHAEVNAQVKNGDTALILAAQYGHTDCVTALIAAKAEVKAQDNNGETALTLTQQHQQPEIVTALKAAGARE